MSIELSYCSMVELLLIHTMNLSRSLHLNAKYCGNS